jgi:hypothetical protein
MSRRRPQPPAGATGSADLLLVFAEADYRYGVGPLKLRVERIDRASATSYDGEIWYPVSGVEVAPDGRELQHREVVVRARRLPS